MNEKAGSHDLNDEDIVDENDDAIVISSNDENENIRPSSLAHVKKPVVKAEPSPVGPIAWRPLANRLSAPPRRAARAVTQEFLNNISGVLNPAAQAACTEDQTARSLQTSQIFSLNSQLRETQNLVKSLRSRILEADCEQNAAERHADRAEMMLLLESRAPRDNNTPHCPDRHVRQDVYYADGGQATQWIGSDDDAFPDNDSPGTRRYTRYSSTQGTPTRSHSGHPSSACSVEC